MPAKTQRKKRPANFPDPQTRLAAVSSKQRLVESAPGPVVDQAARVTTDKQRILTLCILLVATTLAIYYRATSNPFVNYDDWGYVTENHHVQQGLSRDTLR